MIPVETTLASFCVAFVETQRCVDGGCLCPVCGTYNKVKRYKLMQQHFDILDALAQTDEALHCREFVSDGQAYNKMLNVPKHYGFIQQPGTDPTQPFNRSGMWSITERGRQFICNALKVPAHFWGINDNVLWWARSLQSLIDMQTGNRRCTYKDMIEEMAASPVDAVDRGTWTTAPNY